MLIETDIAAFIISQRIFTSDKTTFVKIIKNGWCIFGPTPIPSTAYPTYNHVVLTAVVGPMHCRSDGHVKNSILVHGWVRLISFLGRALRLYRQAIGPSAAAIDRLGGRALWPHVWADLRKMPIQPTKNGHPTYEKCPSDLQKCPSDLRKMPIRPTKKAHPTSYYNVSKWQLKVWSIH